MSIIIIVRLIWNMVDTVLLSRAVGVRAGQRGGCLKTLWPRLYRRRPAEWATVMKKAFLFEMARMHASRKTK